MTYNDRHPDDRAENHVPFLLRLDGSPIGVARLDLQGRIAVVRLVAVSAEHQGRGHGRALDALLVAEAARHGVEVLRVNAALDAVGFYEKTGWCREAWDASELTGIAEDCVQMTKEVGRPG
jgi:N-acetylglutamate synthase-like GNAT family acetyltransferase